MEEELVRISGYKLSKEYFHHKNLNFIKLHLFKNELIKKYEATDEIFT